MAVEPNKAQQWALLVHSIFSITAFVLMFIGFFHCDFIKFTSTSGTSEPISLQFSIWNYQYWSFVSSPSGNFILESCHAYPNYIDIDGSWKAARAFSFTAFIFAIIVLVAAFVSICSKDPTLVTYSWEATVLLLLLTTPFQGLTLLFLNSNACNNNMLVRRQDEVFDHIVFPDTCSISTGAKYSISSTVFFFVSAVASLVAHRAERMEMKAEEHRLREPLNL